MEFTSNAESVESEKRSKVTYTAHALAKLFPTVIVTPTTDTIMEMDFDPAPNCRPLSSCFITPLPTHSEDETSSVPLCPPHLKLMRYAKSLWARQSTVSPAYSVEPTTSGSFKVISKEMDLDIFLTLPQEDQVMDILEISEDLELMGFQICTLHAFCAVCSHSNLALANSISQYINSEQLLNCLHVSLEEAMLKEFTANFLQEKLLSEENSC